MVRFQDYRNPPGDSFKNRCFLRLTGSGRKAKDHISERIGLPPAIIWQLTDLVPIYERKDS